MTARPCYFWVTPNRRCTNPAVCWNQENDMAFCVAHVGQALYGIKNRVLSLLGWP